MPIRTVKPSPVAITVFKKITAWSFSRWSDYRACPFLAKRKHVDKQKEPSNKYSDRGTLVHDEAKAWLESSDDSKLPKDLNNFRKYFKALKKQSNLYLEEECAWTIDWERTGWFDSNAWLRIKMDAMYVVEDLLDRRKLIIIDYKTGKVNPEEHKLQMELYVLGGLLLYPDIFEIECQLWYLDTDGQRSIFVEKVTEKARLEYQKLWLKRTKAMLNDTIFPPTVNPKCRFCFQSKKQGGACPVA